MPTSYILSASKIKKKERLKVLLKMCTEFFLRILRSTYLAHNQNTFIRPYFVFQYIAYFFTYTI